MLSWLPPGLPKLDHLRHLGLSHVGGWQPWQDERDRDVWAAICPLTTLEVPFPGAPDALAAGAGWLPAARGREPGCLGRGSRLDLPPPSSPSQRLVLRSSDMPGLPPAFSKLTNLTGLSLARCEEACGLLADGGVRQPGCAVAGLVAAVRPH